MVKANVELELSNMRCTEIKAREKSRVAYVESQLEAKVEELKAKHATLKAEKSLVAAELEKLQDNVLGLCEESFKQIVRQTFVLYNGFPSDGDFDLTKDVFEGRYVAFENIHVVEDRCS